MTTRAAAASSVSAEAADGGNGHLSRGPVLAYTGRQAMALAELCRVQQLEPGPYLSDILPAIDDAARAADAAGLTVPSLPEE